MKKSLAVLRDFALEEMQQRIAELEAELIEQARIVGMGAERELALLSAVETATRRTAFFEGMVHTCSPGCTKAGCVNRVLKHRAAELEDDNKLLRDQNTQLDAGLAVLEAQLADAKALADSEGSRVVEYQRKARSLRAQLASGQEPVATVIKNGASRQWMSERLGKFPDGIYSLYTHPAAPAQQPLSDEQILDFGPGQPDAVWSYEDQMYFARAIEAAHGIKEK